MTETYDHIIYFIKSDETVNGLDEIERTSLKIPVLADITELSRFDRTQAQAEGLRPEIKFVIAESLEYSGEQTIEYSGKYYKIIRSERSKSGRGLVFICESTINPWEADTDANAEIGNED